MDNRLLRVSLAQDGGLVVFSISLGFVQQTAHEAPAMVRYWYRFECSMSPRSNSHGEMELCFSFTQPSR